MSKSQRAALEQLLQVEGNRQCADCGRPDPDWASVNLALFLCIDCSGVHRNLGTHISKVKSVRLDTWTDELIEAMAAGGNARGKEQWEHSVPALYRHSMASDVQVVREQWIRAKYERKEFVAAIDPAAAEPEPTATSPAAPPTAASAEATAYLSGVKEGFLLKKGKDNSKWNKRWFVLKDHSLAYFITQRDAAPKERLDMAGVAVVLRTEQMANQFGLQLVYTKGESVRNYFVCADNGKDLMDWLMSLRACKAKILGLDALVLMPGAPADPQVTQRLTRPMMLEGWLGKTGPQDKAYKRRWFTLQDQALCYYKSPMDATSLGRIVVSKEFKVDLEDTRQNTNSCFQLVTPGRTYHLMADSEEIAAKWIAVLRQVIKTEPAAAAAAAAGVVVAATTAVPAASAKSDDFAPATASPTSSASSTTGPPAAVASVEQPSEGLSTTENSKATDAVSTVDSSVAVLVASVEQPSEGVSTTENSKATDAVSTLDSSTAVSAPTTNIEQPTENAKPAAAADAVSTVDSSAAVSAPTATIEQPTENAEPAAAADAGSTLDSSAAVSTPTATVEQLVDTDNTAPTADAVSASPVSTPTATTSDVTTDTDTMTVTNALDASAAPAGERVEAEAEAEAEAVPAAAGSSSGGCLGTPATVVAIDNTPASDVV